MQVRLCLTDHKLKPEEKLELHRYLKEIEAKEIQEKMKESWGSLSKYTLNY